MKKIILTGGGTAGHVTPNIALLPSLKEENFEVYYIGSYDGIEKQLITDLNIPYYGISSGKLRRYKSLKNLTDPFRVIRGYFQARKLIRKIKPDIVFSKGGFVTVPVVLAAGHKKVPVIIHESDMTPGLANKIAMKSCTKICCNFPETIKYLPSDKAVLSGSPIRNELMLGNKLAGLNICAMKSCTKICCNFPETIKYLPSDKAVLSGSPIRNELMLGNKLAGLNICGFNTQNPVILVVGGSTGALKVNEAVRTILPELLKTYQVVHLCGKDKTDKSLENIEGYKQFEYVSKEMRDLLAMADIVISRAGANAICELLALRKPNLLIPLSANASRGDQILNAKSFKEHGYSMVMEEEEITPDKLLSAVNDLYNNRQKFIDNMSDSPQDNAIKTIMDLIKQYT